MPGDKSIAHRAALLSILAKGPLTVQNYPDSADCARSLDAAKALGVAVNQVDDTTMTLTPPSQIQISSETVIDCGNSGTTARLLSGVLAGSSSGAMLTGDASLSTRPMTRIVKPLVEMGAEVYDTDGHLPLTVRGKKLLPFEYRLPIPSAQVKSCILLAGLSAGCSITIQEVLPSRDHTELMMQHMSGNLIIRDIKPVVEPDPNDPRKKRKYMPESFRREINLGSQAHLEGGTIDIPGDISTAAFFMAAAALSGKSLSIEKVGLNSTRTGFIEHLKSIGCKVEIEDREVVSNESRGTVTVSGGPLKARKISGEQTLALLDEIPIVAVLAAFAQGTTIIRDAGELRNKESDRLAAIAHNLELMGVHCGVVEDGLIIEGGREPNGADFKSFGDHRIAMAFSIAALFAVGPSSIDDDSVVDVSCPGFYQLIEQMTK